MTKHIRKWKEEQVQKISPLAEKYKVIGIASLKNFPGALAKELRKKLQGKAVVIVSRTRLIQKALQESKVDCKGILPYASGSIAVIFTDMDSFELYAFLKRNKVSMPAKAGVIAPDDIVIPAGDTGIPPGPALSDLKAAGLKTVMQGPTISIAEDKVVTKKGEPVSAGIAGALSKLGIKPIMVGLNVLGCLENGQVFPADVLDIDIDALQNNIAAAHLGSFNLAMEVGYFTKETTEALLIKAARQSKAVALEANILSNGTAPQLIAKAGAGAAALEEKIAEAPAEKPAEEKAAEPKEGKPAGEKKEPEAAGKPAAEEKEAAKKPEGKEKKEGPGEEKKEKQPAEPKEKAAEKPEGEEKEKKEVSGKERKEEAGKPAEAKKE